MSTTTDILIGPTFLFSMWAAFGLLDGNGAENAARDAEREASKANRAIVSLESEISSLKASFKSSGQECVVIESPDSRFIQNEAGEYAIVPKAKTPKTQQR